jgi:hypothetical protein
MDKKNTGRNYCCFICEQSYDQLDVFRSHIVTEHKEGDDYVICPSCGIPTRDLIAHYRSKHIGEVIPPGTQTRALIIRDVKKKVKKIGKKVTKFKQGNFYSEKNHCNIFFRSGLELKFIKHLEKNPKVRKYKAESLQIEYSFNGGTHNYIPDILVEYTDGKIELWEIKPKSQTKWDKNIAKWKAANVYCKKRNWDFIVMTENALKTLK